MNHDSEIRNPQSAIHNTPRSRLLAWAVLVALIAAAYYPALGFGFLRHDDFGYVSNNLMVRQGLTPRGIAWAFTTFEMTNYHPLTWLSYMLDSNLYGFRAGGFHFTNILLHAVNAVLLFELLLAMTGAAWRSWFVATLFAVHPLHVESVAWISERKDVLSTLFGLLALAAYVRYARQPNLKHYLWVTLAFVCSLLSKQTLVTLPCLFLLLDWWPLRRTTEKPGFSEKPGLLNTRLIVEKLPWLALSVIFSIVVVIAQSRGGAMDPHAALPLSARVGNAIVSYVVYLRMTFWPVGLAASYPHLGTELPAMRVAWCAVLLAIVTALAIVMTKRRLPLPLGEGARYLLVGWLWFLGTLVPMIGLVQVGPQALADRYMYVPLIGLAIAVVWGCNGVAATRIVGCALLVTLTVLSWRQVGYWQTDVALWEHTLTVTENNFSAHANLAVTHYFDGDYAAAEEQLDAALQIDPEAPTIHYNLGLVRLAQKRPEDAAIHFAKAAELNPRGAFIRVQLATVLASLGRHEEARREYQAALEIDPNNTDARRALDEM